MSTKCCTKCLKQKRNQRDNMKLKTFGNPILLLSESSWQRQEQQWQQQQQQQQGRVDKERSEKWPMRWCGMSNGMGSSFSSVQFQSLKCSSRLFLANYNLFSNQLEIGRTNSGDTYTYYIHSILLYIYVCVSISLLSYLRVDFNVIISSFLFTFNLAHPAEDVPHPQVRHRQIHDPQNCLPSAFCDWL